MADFDSLLDELRAIRADKQRIPSYDVADTAVLVDGIETLIARVAELEAERSGMRATEWGVRRDGLVMGGSEKNARWSIEINGGELVTRTAPGPWRVSS